MRKDWRSGLPVRLRGRRKNPLLASRDFLASGNLDYTRPVRGALHNRTTLIMRVEALLDILDKQSRQLLRVIGVPPVSGIIILRQVQACRRQDVHAGVPRNGRELAHIPAAVAGHGVDKRSSSGALEFP